MYLLLLLSGQQAEQRLGVLAQWRLENGGYVPMPLGENIAFGRGVRSQNGVLQMGLTEVEIMRVYRQLQRFLGLVDRGRYTLVPKPGS